MEGRPVSELFLLSERQMTDRAVFPAGAWGSACGWPEYHRLIPLKNYRKSKPPYDWHLYKKRHLIENMFPKLKDR